MTPNQYRCETCKHMKTHTSKGGLPFEERCEVSGYPPRNQIFENKLAIVGCASHSDFESERETVLDEGMSEPYRVLIEYRGCALKIRPSYIIRGAKYRTLYGLDTCYTESYGGEVIESYELHGLRGDNAGTFMVDIAKDGNAEEIKLAFLKATREFKVWVDKHLDKEHRQQKDISDIIKTYGDCKAGEQG